MMWRICILKSQPMLRLFALPTLVKMSYNQEWR